MKSAGKLVTDVKCGKTSGARSRFVLLSLVVVLNICSQLQNLNIHKAKLIDNTIWQSLYNSGILVMYFQLLSKISAAWQWTVCRRIGLFAADLKVESPLAAFSDSRSPPTPPNVAPHDIWIKFLARRFQVIKYYSYDQVS